MRVTTTKKKKTCENASRVCECRGVSSMYSACEVCVCTGCCHGVTYRCKNRSGGQRQRASSCSRNVATVGRVVGWHLVLFFFFAFLLCVFVASGSLTEWCEEQDRARYSWCTYTYGTDHQHSGGNEASGSDDGRRPLAEKSSVALHTASYVQTSGRPPRPATQHRRHPPSPPQPRRDEGEGGLHFFVRGGCGGTRAPLSCRPANG